VRDGAVVGRGWTQPGGRPHAETEALDRAGAAARGATAYVSLEPCSHWGKTPPCAEALIAAGLARVVGALEDPDPRVAGAGYAKLEAAGFRILVWQDKTAIAIAEALAERAKAKANPSPPPSLGIHLILGADFAAMMKNSLPNLEEGRIGLINAVLERVG